MRRAGGLFPQVVSLENLHRAYLRARRGKRFLAEVAAFSLHLGANLADLSRRLARGTWEPGRPTTFWIREPKRRLISAAPFADRVVHHAIVDVIEPIVDRSMVADTFACRHGKGLHAALDRASSYARRYPWVFKTDIEKFFPSVDHDELKALLRRRFRERPLLDLLDRVIDGAEADQGIVRWFPGDDLFTPLTRRRGLPIGNLTSQLFANAFLDPLDHHVKETLRIPGYVRYMDDLLLFAEDRARLRDARDSVVAVLEARRLRLSPQKTKITPLRHGVTFLGCQILATHRRLATPAKVRQRRRLKRLRRDHAQGAVSRAAALASVVSMRAHARWLGGRRMWAGFLARRRARVGSPVRS